MFAAVRSYKGLVPLAIGTIGAGISVLAARWALAPEFEEAAILNGLQNGYRDEPVDGSGGLENDMLVGSIVGAGCAAWMVEHRDHNNAIHTDTKQLALLALGLSFAAVAVNLVWRRRVYQPRLAQRRRRAHDADGSLAGIVLSGHRQSPSRKFYGSRFVFWRLVPVCAAVCVIASLCD